MNQHNAMSCLESQTRAILHQIDFETYKFEHRKIKILPIDQEWYLNKIHLF